MKIHLTTLFIYKISISINLINIVLIVKMPHESTVNPYEPFGEEQGLRRVRRGSSNTEVNFHTAPSESVLALQNAVANQAASTPSTSSQTSNNNPASATSAPASSDSKASTPVFADDDTISIGLGAAASTNKLLATISEKSFERRESQSDGSHLKRPELPTELTHHEDFDDDDEDSDEANKSLTPPDPTANTTNQ